MSLPARRTKRRREAPEQDAEWWVMANHHLAVRSGGMCERGCGTDLTKPGARDERHHRMRTRDGGDRLSNLLLLCSSCHRHVHAHPTEAVANGWIVRVSPGVPAAEVAVRLADGYLYHLDDYGGRSPVR